MKEFEFINNKLKPIAPLIGDDCVFYDGYAVTKDLLISGTHFFEEDEPFNLARKALRVNLSDLAACGAKPYGFLLGLALPKGTNAKWLSDFTDGLKSDMSEYHLGLLGGDTTSHKGELVISITAIGKTTHPIKRDGAKVGDNIFVSGPIGCGYLGLRSKRLGMRDVYSKKYDLPTPRLDIGLKLHGTATACIDISDGLMADLGHICKASGVGAELISKDIPLASKEFTLTEQITAGDDYELCFTSNKPEVAGCHKIGKIIAANTLKLDGKPVAAKGYEHL